MRFQLNIFIILILTTNTVTGQSIKRNLLSSNFFSFKQNAYVYGYEQNKDNLQFRCFSYNHNLTLKDSINFNLGKRTPADFLDISVDTLHDVINFYFQLANQKNMVSLLRLNDTLGKICSAENYDANHINSLSAFDDEKYYYANSLYIIRTSTSDTNGKQFYLSKYNIQSLTKPFEYDFKWQFAFERQFIHRATVLYADSIHVIVYAHVNDGPKKGQWILRINSKNGELLKGTRLNGKIDQRHYLVSNFIYNKKSRSIDLIGNIYGSEMIDFAKKTSNFINLSKRNTLFLISIDSTGEIKTKTEKLLALPLQTNTGKSIISYHLKIREFRKTNDTDFDVWADLYELRNPVTLAYYSSWQISIKPDDVDYAFSPGKFFITTAVLPKLINPSDNDPYGKFLMSDIGDYDKFKYKPLLNPVVIKTGINDLQNPFYVIKKTEISNATKTYYHLFVGKKGLESKTILKAEQGQKAQIYFTTNNSYISFTSNPANSEFELRVNSL